MSFLHNLLGVITGPKEQKMDDDGSPPPIPEEEINPEISVTTEPEEPPKPEETQNNLNGKIAINNGILQIIPPQEGGEPPSIQPGLGVKVFINGQEVTKITSVQPEDQVEILLDNKPVTREMEVKIPLDQMEAYLDIFMEDGLENTLDDYPAKSNLLVEGKRKELKPVPWTKTELEEALQKAGVVHGIDYSALEEALNGNGGHFLVAKGTPYTPGQDAYIEYCFLEDNKLIPSVEDGDLVAVKHLSVPGKDGMTVTGRVIVAPSVKDCQLYGEKGVKISEDGLQAIATESGRPMVKKDAIYIEPVYILNEDVTNAKNNGHLAFKGHLVVTGSIQEGMKIETGGDLEVNGGVVESKLLSGGTVKVNKSLIASQVSSGRFQLIYDSVLDKLKEIDKETKELLDAALQIKSKAVVSANKEISEDKIILILLSSRFPNFLSLMKEVLVEIEPIMRYLSKEILAKLGSINNYHKHPPEKINELPNLYQLVKEIIESLGEYFANSGGDVIGYYLQNCQIESSGSIYINGMGCYNSVLLAKGEVKVEGTPGIFRGGKIVAGDKVYIKELGCPSGAPTLVEVPSDKKIEADLVYPGVTLKIGNKVHRNHSTVKNFDIYLDKEGNLQVTSLKGE